MIRLIPRSLFARMVLVLLGGLVVAQLLSFAVHWRERGEFISRSLGARSAQRIGDIVRLLDSIAPEERGKIVSVLSSQPLRITRSYDVEGRLQSPHLPAPALSAWLDDALFGFSAATFFLVSMVLPALVTWLR